MSNLIARAEHEVFIATNFWMISDPSRLITAGLVELSKRAGETQRRPVVKVMYDRGSVKQVSPIYLKRQQILTIPVYQ
jgi:hypothetical protein